MINEANDLMNVHRKASKWYESDDENLPSNEFKKITLWDAWQLYEESIQTDASCETLVTSYINELKTSLIDEFLL